MLAVTWSVASNVIAQATQRWREIDPLLPGPGFPPPGCGARLVVAGPDAQPAAVAECEHWPWTPTSFDLSWGAARRFQLTAPTVGGDVATSLDQLLSLWGDHLASVPGTDARDTVAVVAWPSRDIDGVTPLLLHGFCPLGVIVARETSGRHAISGAGAGSSVRTSDGAADGTQRAGPARRGLRIRRAGPADIDAVVRLGLDVLQWDAHFGFAHGSPRSMAEALRREAHVLLAGTDTWTWLAERDGTPIGLLSAQQPESATWIAPMVQSAPAAYIKLLDVLPAERGNGVGGALVARLHHEAETAGVAVILLRYEQVNPLAVPFWSRQGYRPLWTLWEARPACAIR